MCLLGAGLCGPSHSCAKYVNNILSLARNGERFRAVTDESPGNAGDFPPAFYPTVQAFRSTNRRFEGIGRGNKVTEAKGSTEENSIKSDSRCIDSLTKNQILYRAKCLHIGTPRREISAPCRRGTAPVGSRSHAPQRGRSREIGESLRRAENRLRAMSVGGAAEVREPTQQP